MVVKEGKPTEKCMSELEQRIEQLESASSFQDKLQSELSAVVAEQQRVLDLITPHLRKLSQQVEQMQEANAKPTSEKPPHY